MLTAKLILERLDKEGRLLERREQQSRSFTLGFLQLLYVAHAQIQAAAPYSMTDIDGVARDIDSQGGAGYRYVKANLMLGSAPGSSGVACWPGTGDIPNPSDITIEGEKIGIVIGTGVGAVTPTDIALGTRILHGTQANRFEYGGCELIGIAFSDPDGEFTIRRYFTNASGGPITVEEVGIYSVGTYYTGKDAWPFCIARDLTGGVAVADTEILKVTYVPQITV